MRLDLGLGRDVTQLDLGVEQRDRRPEMEPTYTQLEHMLRSQQTVLMVTEGCIGLPGPCRDEHDSQTANSNEEEDTWISSSPARPSNTEDLDRFTGLRHLLEPQWLELCSRG